MPDATAIVEQISGQLETFSKQVIGTVGQDQSFTEIWGWTSPAINRLELARLITSPNDLARNADFSAVEMDDFNSLTSIPGRISYISSNALGNLPGSNSFHVYLVIKSLIDVITTIYSKYSPKEIDWETVENDKTIPAVQIRKLKQTEKIINHLSGSTDELAKKVEGINSAFDAANSLPTNLAQLADARAEFEESLKALNLLSAEMQVQKKKVDQYVAEIEVQRKAAMQQMQNIDAAYSAATTQGLGKAFGDKADRLTRSTWGLFTILAATLGLGAWITATRVDWLHKFMEKPNISMSLLWVNVALTVASVAGPIWFAWLITKQIGQRFKLAEDYEFKASVAKAYEGYRREAAHTDPSQAKRLFSLALDRLSEEPLRHVEQHSHGSPLHELLSATILRNQTTKATPESKVEAPKE